MMRLQDDRECRTCGLEVTQRFRRVHGDNADVAHRCYHCDLPSRVHRGSAAGREVAGVDPLDEPWRFYDSDQELPDEVHALIAERQQRPVAADGGVADD